MFPSPDLVNYGNQTKGKKTDINSSLKHVHVHLKIHQIAVLYRYGGARISLLIVVACYLKYLIVTCVPPTPITYINCVINNVANRFMINVPDMLLKSENKL